MKSAFHYGSQTRLKQSCCETTEDFNQLFQGSGDRHKKAIWMFSDPSLLNFCRCCKQGHKGVFVSPAPLLLNNCTLFIALPPPLCESTTLIHRIQLEKWENNKSIRMRACATKLFFTSAKCYKPSIMTFPRHT